MLVAFFTIKVLRISAEDGLEREVFKTIANEKSMGIFLEMFREKHDSVEQ